MIGLRCYDIAKLLLYRMSKDTIVESLAMTKIENELHLNNSQMALKYYAAD
jgi:hypothetical protein